MTAGASVATLSTAELSSTDTVTPELPAMPRNSSRAARIASIGCFNCESCACSCSQICGMRPLHIDKGAAMTSANTTTMPMNSAVTTKADSPQGTPSRSSRTATGPSIRPMTIPMAIGASMYSPACSAKMNATRPIRTSEAWAPCAISSSTFDFGGSRTIGAFLRRSRTIGAFFGSAVRHQIFRLDSIMETPFHAARFRHTEPPRVSGV